MISDVFFGVKGGIIQVTFVKKKLTDNAAEFYFDIDKHNLQLKILFCQKWSYLLTFLNCAYPP